MNLSALTLLGHTKQTLDVTNASDVVSEWSVSKRNRDLLTEITETAQETNSSVFRHSVH